MKKWIPAILCALCGMAASAKSSHKTQTTSASYGYEVTVNFKMPVTDSQVFLARYFGKGLPTVYKMDSAVVKNKHTAVFHTKDSVLGGMYIVMYNNRAAMFQLLIDNGYRFTVNVDSANAEPVFVNSQVNTDFTAYDRLMMKMGQQQEKLKSQLPAAKSKADSNAIFDKSKLLAEEANTYRKNYIRNNPKSFLSVYFRAFLLPDVPKGTHYKADGKTIDSAYAFYYNKAHYWTGYDFNDDRLVISPILDGKLSDYFNNYVIPVPDTFNKDADALLANIPRKGEHFKYMLTWLANFTITSKIMGMDASFVHLVDEYYAKGDAYWLDTPRVEKYITQANKIRQNIVGESAKPLDLQDIWDLHNVSLYSVKAPYTLVVFWSPECGHCQKEIPLLDSVYESDLKQKGVVVYSVPTEGEQSNIQKFIVDHHIRDWTNVVDAKNDKSYVFDYDVEATPKIFLLDANKKIIGKSLSHDNILQVIEFYEKKNSKVN